MDARQAILNSLGNTLPHTIYVMSTSIPKSKFNGYLFIYTTQKAARLSLLFLGNRGVVVPYTKDDALILVKDDTKICINWDFSAKSQWAPK